MLSLIRPATGRMLISEPFMMDPNFKRSVILLTEYSEVGAMGFILNHASEFALGDLLPDLSYADYTVYTGGPVANNTLHFIHRCPEKIVDGVDIGNGIYWGGDFETVKHLVKVTTCRQTRSSFLQVIPAGRPINSKMRSGKTAG